ncbi:MAG TPA: type 1 glutamine amidotransferase domain-containing protein [Geothermobacteraceae bacterium]|nr:type 1 glutamine amidotransferase domain-containing protein [Geothermobacteraceae bacterium]
MKILMVLTSNDRLGDTGQTTGFWLEEFAAPYYLFLDAGCEVTLASPTGGQPPIDPKSDVPDAQTAATERLRSDPEAQQALATTRPLSGIMPAAYDAIFYPGGHGLLWDLVDDPTSTALIEAFYAAGKPVSAVCHGPAVLRDPQKPDGSPLVAGKHVTAFSNSEEKAVQLTEVVPFLLEDMLRGNGGNYSRAGDWQEYAVIDDALVTGQNPASSAAVARAVIAMLKASQP